MSPLRSAPVNLYNYCTFIQYPVLARVAPQSKAARQLMLTAHKKE
jgi:hypothetical protein